MKTAVKKKKKKVVKKKVKKKELWENKSYFYLSVSYDDENLNDEDITKIVGKEVEGSGFGFGIRDLSFHFSFNEKKDLIKVVEKLKKNNKNKKRKIKYEINVNIILECAGKRAEITCIEYDIDKNTIDDDPNSWWIHYFVEEIMNL